MATAYLSDDCLKIRFTAWEKVFGFVRDTEFPVTALDSVSVAPDGYRLPHGLRAPGLAVPMRVKVGTWRGRGGRQLVSVRKGQPALHVQVHGSGYSDLMIGTDAADSLAGVVQQAVTAQKRQGGLS